MMKMSQWLVMAGIASAVAFGADKLMAQDNAAAGGAGQDRQGRQGRGNFDPAQMQQRMMDAYKERLEITDDAEWKAIQPMIQKVMDARRDSLSGMARGMFGGGRNRGGDNAGGGGGGDRGGRGGGFFGPPSPESEALQKAIDSKASNADLKAALAKFVEARKAKQAELEKAQADLRKVLSVRQEAIATESGLL
jgi:hypothetical protein